MAGKFNSNLNNISLAPAFVHEGVFSSGVDIHNE